MALDLVGRMRASSGSAKRVWLWMAALAMGGGSWAMHFVGMLALGMPGVVMDYDTRLTLISLAIPVVAAAFGFAVTDKPHPSTARLGMGGFMLGSGIALMHYVGMGAMSMGGIVTYDPIWVGISIVIALAVATAAMWLGSRAPEGLAVRTIAASVMGASISGMHYSGMAGAHIEMSGPNHFLEAEFLDRPAMILAIIVSAISILTMATIVSAYDRRMAAAAEREAAASRSAEEQFKFLYKQSPSPLYALDTRGRVLNATDSLLDLLGRNRDEVIGATFAEVVAPSAGNGQVNDRLGGALDGEPLRVRSGSGAVRDVIASARIVKDPQSDADRILGGLTDVTDLKAAEAALRQSRKLETMGQLTGGVAHDFNNLLAVILLNLDMVERGLQEGIPVASFVESARQGALRGASLTQRMLAFARKQEPKREVLDVGVLAAGMMDLLQRSVGPAVRLDMEIQADIPHIRADANQIELALLNLVLNSRDAMAGSGRIVLSADEHPGGVAGVPEGRYVRISVSDNGSGMDSETLARAADPFFTTKPLGEGTGLGLAMVRGMAVQAGGYFTLDSTPGLGTTAKIWLPATNGAGGKRTEETSRPATSTLQPVSDCRRLLVVDDDPLMRSGIFATLADMGHHVTVASGGNKAIEVLRGGYLPDIVITDQTMPEMSGLEFCEYLRAKHPNLPVLIVSGHSDIGGDPSILRLQKPFSRGDLHLALARVCAEHPAMAYA